MSARHAITRHVLDRGRACRSGGPCRRTAAGGCHGRSIVNGGAYLHVAVAVAVAVAVNDDDHDDDHDHDHDDDHDDDHDHAHPSAAPVRTLNDGRPRRPKASRMLRPFMIVVVDLSLGLDVGVDVGVDVDVDLDGDGDVEVDATMDEIRPLCA